MKHWPLSTAWATAPRRSATARRGVVGASSAAHSREGRPRWNFRSRGPIVMVRGGHRGCEHSGELTKTQRIGGAPVKLDKKVFTLKVFGAAITRIRRSNRRHHLRRAVSPKVE